MVLIALGSIGAVMFALVGISQFASLAGERRRIVAAAAGYAGEDEPFLDRLNRWFKGTRVGAWTERELVLAGIRQRPVVVFLVAAAFGILVAYVLWAALAPLFGVLGLASGAFALRAYIRRAKDRRLEAFIVQMPELARVLANATNAGLSISTSIGIAGDELADPARSELQKVSNAIKFGADLESALGDMERRLPSREVAVLISTLLVSARSGGSLVTSLRDIADTLEARKETRREIKTTLAQSVATGYLVIVMGFGMLFMLNVIQPGSVEAMTSHVVGQVALVISGSLFALGFYLIRRMTRFEL
jgi:tight adherence protein B